MMTLPIIVGLWIAVVVVVAILTNRKIFQSHKRPGARGARSVSTGRAPGGVCAGCGYPVRGLTNPHCPECGADLRVVGVNHGQQHPSRSGAAGWPMILFANSIIMLVAGGGLVLAVGYFEFRSPFNSGPKVAVNTTAISPSAKPRVSSNRASTATSNRASNRKPTSKTAPQTSAKTDAGGNTLKPPVVVVAAPEKSGPRFAPLSAAEELVKEIAGDLEKSSPDGLPKTDDDPLDVPATLPRQLDKGVLVQKYLQLAIEHDQAGRKNEAIRMYKQALSAAENKSKVADHIRDRLKQMADLETGDK